MSNDYKISKILSPNDTGENGCHQAGICIPKEDYILNFFPALNKKIKNPRMVMNCRDDSGKVWNFNFIYYNNKFFSGSRNEYRLTGTTAFIKQNNLTSGDEIFLTKNSAGQYSISFKKIIRFSEEQKENRTVLKLGDKWRVISF
jgi:hypothetical protein